MFWSLHHLIQDQEIFMRSRLAFSVLVVTSLLGATTIASAQTEPAAGKARESNAMASMRHHKMHRHHHMGYSSAATARSRPGGRPVSRKPAAG
jgi:hypothetical protein